VSKAESATRRSVTLLLALSIWRISTQRQTPIKRTVRVSRCVFNSQFARGKELNASPAPESFLIAGRRIIQQSQLLLLFGALPTAGLPSSNEKSYGATTAPGSKRVNRGNGAEDAIFKISR
jgi:hypothetical protein